MEASVSSSMKGSTNLASGRVDYLKSIMCRLGASCDRPHCPFTHDIGIPLDPANFYQEGTASELDYKDYFGRYMKNLVKTRTFDTMLMSMEPPRNIVQVPYSASGNGQPTTTPKDPMMQSIRIINEGNNTGPPIYNQSLQSAPPLILPSQLLKESLPSASLGFEGAADFGEVETGSRPSFVQPSVMQRKQPLSRSMSSRGELMKRFSTTDIFAIPSKANNCKVKNSAAQSSTTKNGKDAVDVQSSSAKAESGSEKKGHSISSKNVSVDHCELSEMPRRIDSDSDDENDKSPDVLIVETSVTPVLNKRAVIQSSSSDESMAAAKTAKKPKNQSTEERVPIWRKDALQTGNDLNTSNRLSKESTALNRPPLISNHIENEQAKAKNPYKLPFQPQLVNQSKEANNQWPWEAKLCSLDSSKSTIPEKPMNELKRTEKPVNESKRTEWPQEAKSFTLGVPKQVKVINNAGDLTAVAPSKNRKFDDGQKSLIRNTENQRSLTAPKVKPTSTIRPLAFLGDNPLTPIDVGNKRHALGARTKSLRRIYDEFMKVDPTNEVQAREKALQKEKDILDNTHSSVGYISGIAGAIRTIRNSIVNVNGNEKQN